MTEAAAAQGIPVEWRSLSLGVLNEGKDTSEKYRAHFDAARQVHRIIAASRLRPELIAAVERGMSRHAG